MKCHITLMVTNQILPVAEMETESEVQQKSKYRAYFH